MSAENATDTFQHDAFLSYSHRDGEEFITSVDEKLRKRGLEVWIDKRGIPPDRDLTVELETEIERARFVIVCITPDVVQREKSFVT